MKHLLCVVLLSVVLIVQPVGAAPVTAPEAPAANAVRVSQVYGGGGNSGATLRHDFIELFNGGASTISLAGWSVQYASAAGTTWQVTNLGGSLAPGQYYLVREAQGAGGTMNLPTPDTTGTIAIGAAAGKVALASTTIALTGACPASASIVDFVGFGSAVNCYDGSGPTPAPDNTTALLRSGNGCTDTDNNSVDFAAGAPSPRNSSSPTDACGGGDAAPTVTSTSPADGATDVPVNSDVIVTFSKNVTPAGEWFQIACPTSGARGFADTAVAGGSQSFTITPSTDFAPAETCTVTVFAAQVTDQDRTPSHMPADYAWSFTTQSVAVCGSTATPIHDIQGGGAASFVVGQSKIIEGVVVADYQNTAGGEIGGFFVQEEDADADANPVTSEGIYVYNNANPVAAGDKVRVTGTVAEYLSAGYTQTLTELSPATSVTICSSGNAGLVTGATVHLPVANVSDLEAFEGMLVTIPEALTVADNYTLGRYGEVGLAVGGPIYQFTHLNAPSTDGNTAYQTEVAKRSIVLDDASAKQNRDLVTYPAPGLGAANPLRVGDTLPAGVTGVLDQRFDLYRIQPVGVINWTHSNARPAAPPAVGGTLRVAGANMLNYFETVDPNTGATGYICGPLLNQECRGADSAQELTRQQDKLVQDLKGLDADIIGLKEG